MSAPHGTVSNIHSINALGVLVITIVSLNDAVKSAHAEFAPLLAAITEWAAKHEKTIDLDLAAFVCAATRDGSGNQDSLTLWTRTGVQGFLSCDSFNYCSSESCKMPGGVPEALWVFLDFLYDTGHLDPRSDPLWELRKPLICYAGLGFDGRERPKGSGRLIPCECHLPYRETVEYVQREFEQGRFQPGWR